MKKRYKILTVIIVAVISVFLVGSLVLSRMAKSEFLITDIYNLSFRETAAFSNDDGLSYQDELRRLVLVDGVEKSKAEEMLNDNIFSVSAEELENRFGMSKTEAEEFLNNRGDYLILTCRYDVKTKSRLPFLRMHNKVKAPCDGVWCSIDDLMPSSIRENKELVGLPKALRLAFTNNPHSFSTDFTILIKNPERLSESDFEKFKVKSCGFSFLGMVFSTSRCEFQGLKELEGCYGAEQLYRKSDIESLLKSSDAEVLQKELLNMFRPDSDFSENAKEYLYDHALLQNEKQIKVLFNGDGYVFVSAFANSKGTPYYGVIAFDNNCEYRGGLLYSEIIGQDVIDSIKIGEPFDSVNARGIITLLFENSDGTYSSYHRVSENGFVRIDYSPESKGKSVIKMSDINDKSGLTEFMTRMLADESAAE